MSMEITGAYSHYAMNDTNPTGQAGSNTTAKGRSGASANSRDKVQEYYEKLCRKFPQINFNTNGGVLPSTSSKVTVNLSYDCLKKMADDPEFAKEIEWNLSGEAAANSLVYGCAQRDGVVLGGRTVTYDANGNRQSSCGGMRTANAGNKTINKLQKMYKTEKDRDLKARQKREEKTAERRKEKRAKEEKAAERQRKKNSVRKALMDKLPEREAEKNYAVSAGNTAVNHAVRNLIAVSQDTVASSAGSLDVRI